MKVGELPLQQLQSADPEDSLADAADRMRFYEVGSLAVFEDSRLVGIITERDLLRAMADRVNAGWTPVTTYMTTDPTVVTPDADVEQALELMLSIGARHLPVVEGTVVHGMVSMRDLMSARKNPTKASRSGA